MNEPEKAVEAVSTTTVMSCNSSTSANTSSNNTQPIMTAPTTSTDSAPTPVSESDADVEFEPTAEMMVDEFDDERTLDEAEAEAAIEGDDQEEEISNLQKEQDMPIEELLAMYAGASGSSSAKNGSVPEEVTIDDDDDEEMDQDGDNEVQEIVQSNKLTPVPLPKKDISLRPQPPIAPPESVLNAPRPMERRARRREGDLIQLYPELDANGDNHNQQRALRSASGQQSDMDEDVEEGDGEGESGEEGEGEEYRKTIMIGSCYQAQVPEGLQSYGPTPPYENQDKLLWAPHLVSVDEVEKFLYTASQPSSGTVGVQALPLGLHIRDDEQALHLLLQCGGNVEEARRRHNMNRAPIASTMTLWSEEECRNFENGLKNYGKDFHMIQQNKVRTRSVGELVQFYYLWKKTERHDMFAAKTRLEKKKFIVHPGTTDFMDRFLDEGDGGANYTNQQQHTNNTDGNEPQEESLEEINANRTSSFSCNSAMIGSTRGPSSSSSSNGENKRKREYIIPELPPSEEGLKNQKKWRESQKPSVEMHALLYGRLPAGYKAKVVSSKGSTHLHPHFGGAVGTVAPPANLPTTSASLPFHCPPLSSNAPLPLKSKSLAKIDVIAQTLSRGKANQQLTDSKDDNNKIS